MMTEPSLTETQRLERLEQQVAAITVRLAQLESAQAPVVADMTKSLFAAAEGATQNESLNHFQ
ncbi:hypothetical protein C7B82_23910 [Stenomitos frigidus ULC18]|uniref:Uncharacterized protein n=2 Tax=Stenomitos TaxID=1844270 RepID=A0A2T1DY00_9CYAN|nr:hypothetical protein C7B82_23910 [Stenomitos frigidus ULC18]